MEALKTNAPKIRMGFALIAAILCIIGAAAPAYTLAGVTVSLVNVSDVQAIAGMAILLGGALFNILSIPWAMCGRKLAFVLGLVALLLSIVGTALAGNAGSPAADLSAASAGIIPFSRGPSFGGSIAGVIFTFASVVLAYNQRKGEPKA
jgi:cytosine/uracil/thiamine/allantoin permease